jgi:hypothetical protein
LAAVDAGVAEPDVDRAQVGAGRFDQIGDPVLRGGVSVHGVTADLRGHGADGFGVEVVDNNPCSFGGQAPGQRPADAMPGAGDDHSPSGYGHGVPPVSIPPLTTSKAVVINAAS